MHIENDIKGTVKRSNWMDSPVLAEAVWFVLGAVSYLTISA